MVVAQLGRMGRSRTEPPEAHIYFTTLMYAGWAVPARAYGTRPEDWRSDLEHTYFSQNPHRPILRLTVLLFFGGPTVRGPMLLSTPVFFLRASI